MLFDESTQTCDQKAKRALQNKFIEGSIKAWKEKQENHRIKKLQEQKQMKEMLEKYWPWDNPTRPRGLRNLHLEGIFPEEDFKKAKRFVGSLGFGGPGGGAPIFSQNGKMLVRTHEDPFLRFQWSADLRKWVDNTYRYKTNKSEQEEYKKELDKLVEEKMRRQELEKKDKLDFERKQGWSNQATLKRLEEERTRYREQMRKEYDKFSKMKITKPNKITKLDPIIEPKVSRVKKNSVDVKPHVPKNRVSPLLRNSLSGEELVPLMAKSRTKPKNVTLASTDVTRGTLDSYVPKWKLEGAEYLRELSKQMKSKNDRTQKSRSDEMETVRRHFSTWDSFWGRPGNGAPMPVTKKACLDRLLYPQMVPISVH